MVQHALVYNMVSWDKVFADAFHNGIQNALEKLRWWLEPNCLQQQRQIFVFKS